jgi:hypothetical protein
MKSTVLRILLSLWNSKDSDPPQTVGSGSNLYQSEKSDPDPYQSEKQDSDQNGLDPLYMFFGANLFKFIFLSFDSLPCGSN